MSEHNERDGVERLRRWVDGCNNIVFFGGAGVSTESGIPDFRSEDGLYRQHYDWPPETIAFTGRRCWSPVPSPARPTWH